jgi:hypothetical protein
MIIVRWPYVEKRRLIRGILLAVLALIAAYMAMFSRNPLQW